MKATNIVIETTAGEDTYPEVDTFAFNPMGFITLKVGGKTHNYAIDSVLYFSYDVQEDEQEMDMTNVVVMQ
jgi:hypothetical protein